MPEETITTKDTVSEEKAKIVDKIHEMILALKIDLSERMPVHDQLVQDSKKKHDEFVSLLNEKLVQIEVQTAEKDREINALQEAFEIGVKAKEDSQKEAEKTEKDLLASLAVEEASSKASAARADDENKKLEEQILRADEKIENLEYTAREAAAEEKAILKKLEKSESRAEAKIEKLTARIETLEDKLEEALNNAETAIGESKKITEKHEKLQKQWNSTL